MKIELHRITVRELVDGYVDDVENGVRGYGGRLDIRPAYQREFVYREKERNAVISTYNPKELERQTTALMADREVQKKAAYTNTSFRVVRAWRGLTSVSSATTRSVRLTRRRRAYARGAAEASPTRKWRATTLCRGRRGARPFLKISRCSVAAVTPSKATDVSLYRGFFKVKVELP